MQNLNEALEDLKDRLINDEFCEGIVEKVANDWNLKVVLLERKFVEKYQRPVCEFKALNKSTMKELAIKAAMKMATEVASENFSGGCIKAGKLFVLKDGEEYITVCYAKNGLHAIRVCDTQWRVWHDKEVSLNLIRKYSLIDNNV